MSLSTSCSSIHPFIHLSHFFQGPTHPNTGLSSLAPPRLSNIRANPYSSSPSSSLAGKTTGLDLAEGAGPSQEGGGGDGGDEGQDLEQVPTAVVVEQEDTLHEDQGAEEDDVRERRLAQRRRQVAYVAAEGEPLRI